MVYTSQDRSFIKGVKFELANDFPLGHQSGSGKSMEFQFPPRITSDGRKGSWEEGELRGVEPIAVFKTSGAREISLKWTYIVDGGKWTAERVSNNVKKLRGYFAQLKGEGGQPVAGSRAALIVKFKMWRHGDPRDYMTARIKAIDVKHGETLVCDTVDGRRTGSGAASGRGAGRKTFSDAIFPLRTDITVDLRLWSQGSAAKSGDKPHQDLKGLLPSTPPLWY